MRARAPLAAALAVAALGVGWSGARLDALGSFRPPGEELLYLPNGKMLKVASLGQAPVIADAIYLWAIQYYSNYEREDRFAYVEHVFGDVVGELDPEYIDPYWIGALILSVEAKDLEAAHRLLDKGFARNPDAWILPYLAGWEAYFVGEYELAGRYFEKAAAVEGSPPKLRRMIAGMQGKAGDLDEALVLWRRVLDDPTSDNASKSIAERKVREITLKLAIRACERAIEAFREQNARAPRSLEELVSRGYLSRVPVDEDGRRYAYDPETGTVTGPGQVLGDQ